MPTTSAFDEIITASGAASKSCERYLYTLLAERIMRRPVVQYVTWAMARGSEAEAEAVAYYELETGLDTAAVGFITNDAGTVGCSPDRLVGDEGLLELKCPTEAVHVAYMLGGGHVEKYKQQLQGQLWLTGRTWVDILSYHPDMPPARARVTRDAAFIGKLSIVVGTFLEHLEALTEQLKASGAIKARSLIEEFDIASSDL